MRVAVTSQVDTPLIHQKIGRANILYVDGHSGVANLLAVLSAILYDDMASRHGSVNDVRQRIAICLGACGDAF